MKGQAYVIPETLVDILQLLIFVAFFIGTFLLFTTYNMIVHSSIEERNAFDTANIIIGNRCLAYEDENGNFYRGIFDKRKLNSGDLCLSLGEFSIEITDFQSEWKFGSSRMKKKYSLPIVIFDDGNFKLGKMVIGY